MAKAPMKPRMHLRSLCRDLQELQRQRVCSLKSRIMLDNRLVAQIATHDGYHAGMTFAERKRRFDAARKTIGEVNGNDGKREADRYSIAHPLAALIRAASIGIDGFDVQVGAYEAEMERLAKQLPVYEWLRRPEQKGFGLLSLAKLVGETGDLNNYPNPGKLWRRMGCAPFGNNADPSRMLMPSTWRRMKPGLSAAEWEECGYNPRRRSLAYLIGEGLVKQNGEGPYRQRYDEAKARAAETHPEWFICSHCEGGKKTTKGKCANCKGTGRVTMHAHLHGMLLATKLLFKNLWIEWTGGDSVDETERHLAAP